MTIRKFNMFEQMLDTLPQQVALLDHDGRIEWVNRAWISFSDENEGPQQQTWGDFNYFHVCADSSAKGDPDAGFVMTGMQSVIDRASLFYDREYPCHSLDKKRWFTFSFRPLELKSDANYFIAAHSNITDRVLAEERISCLANQDGLTGLANRRRFDEFLGEEWRRAMRLDQMVALILFDVDNFKKFNDNYGHIRGDDCLRQIGGAIRQFARRPADLVARYGGEEFAVILGNTSLDHAASVAESIRSAIHDLAIPHAFSIDRGIVTVSGGVAAYTLSPDTRLTPDELIAAADKGLYASKENGRDRFTLVQPGE